MVRMGVRAVQALFLVLLLGLVGACKSSTDVTLIKRVGSTYMSEPELRLRLVDYLRQFGGLVSSASETIGQSDDYEVRRYAIYWKTRYVGTCASTVFLGDPVAALLDTWILTRQMQQYYEEGEGKDVFGDQQPLAIDTCRRLDASISAIAAALWPESHERQLIESKVDGWVDEHPMGHEFRVSITPELVKEFKIQRPRGFDAIAGMDQTLAEIANRITVYMELIPHMARWHSELAMEDALQRKEFKQSLDDLTVMATSLDVLATSVRELPALIEDSTSGVGELMRAERESVFKEFDRQREDTLDQLGHERKQLLKEVDRQRLETLEHLAKERAEVLAAVRGERVETLAEIREERKAVLEFMREERKAVMAEMRDLTLTAVKTTFRETRGLIDDLFEGLVVAGAIFFVVIFAGAFVIARRLKA